MERNEHKSFWPNLPRPFVLLTRAFIQQKGGVKFAHTTYSHYRVRKLCVHVKCL